MVVQEVTLEDIIRGADNVFREDMGELKGRQAEKQLRQGVIPIGQLDGVLSRVRVRRFLVHRKLDPIRTVDGIARIRLRRSSLSLVKKLEPTSYNPQHSFLTRLTSVIGRLFPIR
ncbi:hypothetical protein NDU88_006018 [Pleurodeles waltl]|uniref:Uncharacterized protein n=1 Tax=Pleurodeles waltl TaxID=8319 RepID=A0AAV7X197_PLEWA|nr:hypothetical protein NDU88_006018 [Pleurodeles waltl]